MSLMGLKKYSVVVTPARAEIWKLWRLVFPFGDLLRQEILPREAPTHREVGLGSRAPRGH